MIQVEQAGRRLRVTGGEYELTVPLDFGPRILSLRLQEGPDVLREVEPQAGGGGGHRVCVAPERRDVTWVDDNRPVTIEHVEDYRLIVRGGREDRTGLIREIAIEIDDGVINVTHQIYNTNPWTIELAPWAQTALRPGGWAIAPFPARGTQSEATGPSNPLVMWPYTDLSDERWKLLPGHVTLRQDSNSTRSPQKIGSFREETWCSYVWNGYVFEKRSQAYEHMDYPDMGCSFELFTDPGMLKLETLSPIVTLEPGECVRHEEEWSLTKRTPQETGTPWAPGPIFLKD